MIASGYSVSLTCDVCEYSQAEFGGSETVAPIWRGVKAAGWIVSWKTRKCVCPECNQRRKSQIERKESVK